MKIHHSVKHITTFAVSLICTSAQAQKLPNVQKDGVRAPANIRIDGKTTEWDNKFEAYNKATDVFYTISNDDNYLYVTVQATQAAIIRKIIGGGVLNHKHIWQKKRQRHRQYHLSCFRTQARALGKFKRQSRKLG